MLSRCATHFNIRAAERAMTVGLRMNNLSAALGAAFESKAADHLSAAQVTWNQHFGSSTADTNKLFSLMAHGYFRAGPPMFRAWLMHGLTSIRKLPEARSGRPPVFKALD